MFILSEKQIEKIEELGFIVRRDEDDGMYRFSKGSSAGQDFFFEVEPGEDLFDLSENVYRYYESYDVSEETALWIDSTGHGKNGAPHDIEDIVADMKECEQFILDLYELLREMHDEEFDEEENDEEENDEEENDEEESEAEEPSFYMTLEEFYEYILENFTLSDEAKRLVKNILDYAANRFWGDDLYHFVCEMFDNTIGLSDAEIRRVSN